jgi:hypothetical protein
MESPIAGDTLGQRFEVAQSSQRRIPMMMVAMGTFIPLSSS